MSAGAMPTKSEHLAPGNGEEMRVSNRRRVTTE
jgi:hypothetical protein